MSEFVLKREQGELLPYYLVFYFKRYIVAGVNRDPC